MSTFRRITSDESSKLAITFSSQEAHVLINLTEQLLELLAEGDGQSHQVDPLLHLVGISSADSLPEDPVLRRLLPNAYDDERAAGEFRRYTESTLRTKKYGHSMSMRVALKSSVDGIIELDHDGANDWLGAMNDIRLALGVRLQVEQTSHEELELLSPDDPMRGVYAVYGWLGWLQESLIVALMDEAI